MALACARCGTQNPDGNSFCQACGSPLVPIAQTAPAGPPPGTPPPQIMGPPPDVPPPSYQSPYYTPSPDAPQPSVNRTPWVVIVSAVVGLVLVMSACGTALAIFNSRNASQTSSSGLGSGLPSPTPAGTPTPIVKSSPTAPGAASNASLTVTVPSGWLVANKDSETITLIDASGESVTVGSGPSEPSQTAQQNKDTLDAYLKGKYPDTRTCPNTKVTTGSISGAPGIFWTLCFTLTSGGQSLQVGAPLFAGANKDGSVYYAVILLSPVTNMDAFIGQTRPILASIQWALK